MMANKENTGTMTLPSRTAVALWVNEICGQISDGMWENSGPHNHWQFWCRLDVTVGPKATLDTKGAWVAKNAYALTRLHQEKFDDGKYVLRDRMVACARLAIAGVDLNDRQTLHAAEYMPATLAEFRANKASGKWQYDFVNKYVDNISDEIAVKFYEATYTLKEMNADLKLIMSTMKLARKF